MGFSEKAGLPGFEICVSEPYMNICFVFRVWDGVKVCKICLTPIPILNIHVKVVYRVVRFFETHF